MIDPVTDDIGRRVVFYGKQGDNLMPAYGRVSGFDAKQVFVRFAEDGADIPTRPDDLYWVEPEMTQLAPSDETTIVEDETLLLPF